MLISSEDSQPATPVQNIHEFKVVLSDSILEYHVDDEAKVTYNSFSHQQQQYSESKSYWHEDESKEYISSSSSSSSASASILLHEDDEYENKDDSNLEDKTAAFVEPYNDNYHPPSYFINENYDSNDAIEYNADEDDYEGNNDINEDYIDDFELDDDSSYNDIDEVDSADHDVDAGEDYIVVGDLDNNDGYSDQGDVTESLYSNKEDISSSSSSLPHGTMVSDTSSELLANEVLLSDESSSSIEVTRRNDTSYSKNNLNDSSIISVKNQSLNNNNVENNHNYDNSNDIDDEVEMESLYENSHNFNAIINDKTEASYYISEQSLSSYKYCDDKDQSESKEVLQYDSKNNSNDLSISIESVSEVTCVNIQNSATDDEDHAEGIDLHNHNESTLHENIQEIINHENIQEIINHENFQEIINHESFPVINTSIESVDSPLTSKIRRVVDQELSKIVILPQTYDHDRSNDNFDNDNNNSDENNEDRDDINNYNDYSILEIPTTSYTSDKKGDDGISNPAEIILQVPDHEEKDSHNSMISKVASIAELIVNNTNNSNNKRPGRQRQFIDAETERVSKIMLSKFFRK